MANAGRGACGDGVVNVAHGEGCDDGNTETELSTNFLSCQVCN